MQLDEIIRGDYEEIEVELRDPTGEVDANDEPVTEPRDIANDTLIFTAKLSLKDTANVFQKTSDNAQQIEKTDPTNGRAIIKINPGDTASMTANKTLKCTMEVRDFLDRPATTFHDLPVVWRSV